MKGFALILAVSLLAGFSSRALVQAPARAADGTATIDKAMNEHSIVALRRALEGGADPNVVRSSTNEYPLTDAVKSLPLAYVKLLLAYGAEPDLYQYEPALHAAFRRVPVFTKSLLAAGAKPDICNATGDGALFALSAEGFPVPGSGPRTVAYYVGVLKALVDAGADLEQRQRGETPRSRAQRNRARTFVVAYDRVLREFSQNISDNK